jgi:NhaP-type Na+/H+ or K+/H+ antiporter
MSQNNESQRKNSYTALGLAIGLVLGGIVGLAIDNMIIFAGGGLVLGLAVGSALDSRRLEDGS